MPNALHTLSACEAVERLAQRSLRAHDLVRACLERIDAREGEVQAWQYLARDAALARAKQLDDGAYQGVLHGLPLGVKDLLATADMPTGYGSPIYLQHQAGVDAACVAVARQQGAVVMGKTVTTEFATFQPNQTRNPLNLAHTPGGSSSGSAAAVADHMVPLALGTQTAGSLIRPASYCGVVAYKPSPGLISRAGAKPLSDTLDVVGTLARNVPDAALLASALSGRDALRVQPWQQTRLRVGVCRTYEWAQAQAESQQALEHAAQMLQTCSDVSVHDITLPSSFQTLVQAQTQVQLFEQSHNLAHEHIVHRAQLSARLQGILDSGKAVTHAQYDAALQHIALCRAQLSDVFANVDVLLTLSAQGEAPHGLANTGDPLFCRIWTALHTPSVNLPVAKGPNGLPIGLQVVGLPLRDGLVLSAAHHLMQKLAG